MSYKECLQQAVNYRERVMQHGKWLDTPEYVMGYDKEHDFLTCYSSLYPGTPCFGSYMRGKFEFDSTGICIHMTVNAEDVSKGTPILDAYRAAMKGGQQ